MEWGSTCPDQRKMPFSGIFLGIYGEIVSIHAQRRLTTLIIVIASCFVKISGSDSAGR